MTTKVATALFFMVGVSFSAHAYLPIDTTQQELMDQLLVTPSSRPKIPYGPPTGDWVSSESTQPETASRHHIIPWQLLAKTLNNLVFAHIDGKWQLACPASLGQIKELVESYLGANESGELYVSRSLSGTPRPVLSSATLLFLQEIEDGNIKAEFLPEITANLITIRDELGQIFSWLPFDLLIGPNCRKHDPGKDFDTELLGILPSYEQKFFRDLFDYLKALDTKAPNEPPQSGKKAKAATAITSTKARSSAKNQIKYTMFNEQRDSHLLNTACGSLQMLLARPLFNLLAQAPVLDNVSSPNQWNSSQEICIENKAAGKTALKKFINPQAIILPSPPRKASRRPLAVPYNPSNQTPIPEAKKPPPTAEACSCPKTRK